MKKRLGIMAVCMAMLLCAGVLTGCSETTSEEEETSSTVISSSDAGDETDADSASSETESDASQTEDIIGEVTYIGSSYLSVNVYESDTEISDYTSLDSVTLSDTGESESITLETDAVFEYVSSGYLYSATQDDIAEGDIIAVTTDEDGNQEIIILDYTLDSSASDDSASSSDSASSEEDSADASSAEE